jgi:EAL domain-containing protein (putative c-di-GMP-specific phosphodiesterase class I)
MTPPIVYLIDDEPGMLDLLGDVVEMAGMEPRPYTKASEFFDGIHAVDPNAILVLDLFMPEMDGIEVMRRLAEVPNPPALILISGHDAGVLHSAEELGRAHNLKILASLSKPVSVVKFRSLLRPLAVPSPQAKSLDHKSSWRGFTPRDLQRAILEKELVLHFQPQLDIEHGEIAGVEALVRWQHPEQGLIGPDRFIPLAERFGWMRELTSLVLNMSIVQIQKWKDADFDVTVSINIAADNITSLALPEQLADLLREKKLDPTRLTLEVTESSLMGELATALDILTRLRMKGIKLSIDDFGTGYSSLVQLHRMPFTELKIDRSFVSNMTDDEEARAIVKTCILLGHDLGMQVVAEGIEQPSHLNLLWQMGCDIAQGYLLSRPIPGDDLLAWAQNGGLAEMRDREFGWLRS